jgi:hypothetical protein
MHKEDIPEVKNSLKMEIAGSRQGVLSLEYRLKKKTAIMYG